MNSLTLVLQIVALIFWAFATFGLFPSAKINWWYGGWFFLLLSLMLSGFQLHQITH